MHPLKISNNWPEVCMGLLLLDADIRADNCDEIVRCPQSRERLDNINDFIANIVQKNVPRRHSARIARKTAAAHAGTASAIMRLASVINVLPGILTIFVTKFAPCTCLVTVVAKTVAFIAWISSVIIKQAFVTTAPWVGGESSAKSQVHKEIISCFRASARPKNWWQGSKFRLKVPCTLQEITAAQSGEGGEGGDDTAVVGAVIGTILGVIIVTIIVVFFVWRHRRNGSEDKRSVNQEISAATSSSFSTPPRPRRPNAEAKAGDKV
ncbi:hypothetical protein PoB_004413800 [Plakobranchus ocellatus]|uniref:Uncharacterized protein n=1 Tax=Plakobranchus ocellatus TaxID=259542 RepID=A0AAV4BDI9_9GAST|nr:hypothetical protein PoB_004413800 [Plakobranchus ocellatus]